MELLFVTVEGDARGERSLEILSQKGQPTRLLQTGESAPLGSIALFTPAGPILPELDRQARAKLEKFGHHQREKGGAYLCCSAVQLEKFVPDWAKTTPLWVGLKSTEDRRPKRGGTFAFSLETMAEMFRRWDWADQNQLVPWAVQSDLGIQRNPGTLARFRRWRSLTTSKQLSAVGEDDVRICQAIRRELEKQGGYYVESPSQALKITPDHFDVSQAELIEAEANGPLIWEFWQTSLGIYLKALQIGSGLEWLAQSVEGPINLKQREWQRRLAQNQPTVLPLFARADLSRFWFLVEIQERIGGLGLVESWTRAIRAVQGDRGIIGRRDGFAGAFAQTVREATDKENPVVALVCPTGYEEEQAYFARRLGQYGLEAHVVHKDRMAHELQKDGRFLRLGKRGPRIDLLYRREMNAASLCRNEIGLAILAASLEGKVIVEPPLNMIYDCKSPMAWAHHPETREFFSREVRTIICPTALMPGDPSENFVLDGKRLNLSQTVGQPFVVKYGGENLKYGFGGRAVYHTKDNDDGLERGLSEVRAGHPWIVQPLDETKNTVREWDGKKSLAVKTGAARLMLHYVRSPKMELVELALACANIRPNHWKAAGNKDSVFLEIRVKGEET